MTPLFAGIYVPEQSIWVACALFYLADCVKRISPQRQIVLRRAGRWLLLLPVFSNQPPRRTLTVMDPLAPWTAVLRVTLLGEAGDPATVRLDLHLYQVISVLMFIGLFVVGPSLTLARGLPMAMLAVAPIHLGCLVLLAYAMWSEPAETAAPPMARLGLWLECAIVPGYFVNVVRKRSLLAAPAISAAALLAADMASIDTRGRQRLRDYFADLVESGEITAEEASRLEGLSAPADDRRQQPV